MTLLQMSLSGGVMILAVAVLRGLTLHRLPKNAFLALWAVTAARLLAPFSVSSAFSVYSLLRRLAPAAEAGGDIHAVSLLPFGPADAVPSPPGEPFAARQPVISIDGWTVLWAVGAVVCAAYFVTAYLKCRREFQASLPVESEYTRSWLREHPLARGLEIRQSGRISTPLTYGVFHPVILMPKTTDWNDREALDYVLAHEYAHIRRFDAVTKLVVIAALCVHWFDPAVWLMVRLANRDMELACDEAVIHQFGEGARSAYAMTLIRMEETRGSPAPLCSNFSQNAIEERIVAIMKMKKFSLAAVVVAAVLVLGVTVAFATSAKDGGDLPPTDSDPTSDYISTKEEEVEVYIRREIAEQTAETKELLELYTPFGLSYETDPATGELTMSWQGKPVHSIYDGEKEVWIANSMQGLYLGPDAVDLEAVYQDGKLTGLRETGEESVVNFHYYLRSGDEKVFYYRADNTVPEETETIEDFNYYIWDESRWAPYEGDAYASPQETEPQLTMEVFYYRLKVKDDAAEQVQP